MAAVAPAGRRVKRLYESGRRLVELAEGRNIVIQGVTMAVTFPASLLISRNLGPAGRGAYSLTAMSAAVAALVAGMGIGDAVPYLLARTGTDRGAEPVLLGTLLRAAGIVAAVYLLISWPMLRLLGVPPTPGLMAGGTLMVLLMAIWPFWLNAGTARARTALPLKAEALRVSVYLAAAVAAIAAGVLTAETTLAAYAISLIVAGTVVIGRMRPRMRHSDAVDAGQLRREAVRLGWRGMVARLLEYGASRGDAFVIGAIAGPAAAGAYITATGISDPVSLISSANAPPVLHRLSTDAASGRHWGKYLTSRLFGSAAVALVAALALCAVAAVLVHAALGPRFASAIAPLRILAISAVFLTTTRLMRQANFALGRMSANWGADAVSIAVLVVGNALFLRRDGITAAAFVMLTANATGVLLLGTGLAWASHRHAALHPIVTVVPSPAESVL